MMKYFFILLSTLFVFLTLESCTSSKALAKKAKKLEDSNQYQPASDLYYQSAKKNNTNIDALAGMKRTGSLVLNDYINTFNKAKLDEDYKKATYTYLDAEKYVAKIGQVNVKLEIPEFTQADFRIVKKLHLNKEYDEGLSLIETENFKDAELKFNEVYKFDKNFKEVKELRNIAFLEPFYRKAITYQDNKEYRKAYESYQRILKRLPDYKDTKDNCEYVLRAGQINLVVLDDKEKTKYSLYTNNIKNYTINSIIKKNDPFIKIVDRENLENILTEQELAVSGLVSEENGVEVGALTGAQYALSIKVTNYSVVNKPAKKGVYDGFSKYSEKYFNKTTQKNEYRTKYKKVKYSTYYASRQVNFTVNYRIISLKTGEIITSEMLEKKKESTVNYLVYKGNVKNLYASSNGKVNTSYTEHNRLVELSNSSKTLDTKENLTKKLYKNISQEISNITIREFSK